MGDVTYLLDTDICIYVIRGLNPRLRARLAEQDEGTIAISAVTLAELEIGVRDRPDQRERLAIFLSQVVIIPFGTEAARHYGRLPFRRARFDRLIAGHALASNLTLVTNNERDFANVGDLRIENWTI